MKQYYCGDYLKCEDVIQLLIDNGIEVKYQVNKEGRWLSLESEKELKDLLDPFSSPYLTEPVVYVSYRIPSYKLALMESRRRDEEARIREHLRIEYEQFCERRQARIDAYLKKYPWKGEPEAYKEGIDWLRVNDPEKGEVIVSMR